ncbi:hypothetical protein MPER_11859 [Moniliophthora perniciosa FA553]|nr:hypothetical protein MPER_11859 [Moniliophthora perniciosa FA553]
MTSPDKKKQPILRSFHELTVKPGWAFTECGPDEKDRQLLVEYDQVIDELNRLAPEYRAVILSITHKMAAGMADFAHRAATSPKSTPLYLATIAEYDLYCHYVAGLVGEGLSGLFSASKKEAPWLADQLELSNSLGLLLQKTNIIRDYREDAEEGRYFWPREIWGQKKYKFKDMKDMYAPEAKERAQWVQSEMILDAMRHLTDGLDYLRLLKNQSVFVFCAIPASMAIATLELCFMNPEMFQRNIKIRKAAAADLIMRSTNPRDVAGIFRTYCRKIHAKASPADPNFLKISVACGKGRAVRAGDMPTFDPADARTRIYEIEQSKDMELRKRKRAEEIRDKYGKVETPDELQRKPDGFPWEVILYALGAFAMMGTLVTAATFAVLRLSD